MSEIHDDRPSWLPSKFKSAEDLAKSYSELEQRLGREAQERRALEEELQPLREYVSRSQPEIDGLTEEDLAALNAAEPYAKAVVESVASTPEATSQRALHEAAQGVSQQGSPMDVMALLAQAQAQGRAHTDQQFGQRIGAIPTEEQVAITVADQAVTLLEQTHPSFDQTAKDKIIAEIERTPALAVLTEQAIDSKDPATLATALAGVLAAANERESSANMGHLLTNMKMQAQSASGAGGRPQPIGSDEAEWAAIKAAKPTVWGR